jgi:hypothetical protein
MKFAMLAISRRFFRRSLRSIADIVGSGRSNLGLANRASWRRIVAGLGEAWRRELMGEPAFDDQDNGRPGFMWAGGPRPSPDAEMEFRAGDCNMMISSAVSVVKSDLRR